MQRALRLNKASKELWLAYFRMELECLASVHKTRVALGIASAVDTEAAASAEVDDDGDAKAPEAPADPREAERKAAEAEFAKGAVARIVFTHATQTIAGDVEFELQFLHAVADKTVKLPGSGRQLLSPALVSHVAGVVKQRYSTVSVAA